MSFNRSFSKIVLVLVVAGLILPIAICLILGLASLLGALGDAAGSVALRYVALAGGVVWIVGIVSLVLVQAISSLSGSDKSDE